MKLLRRMYGICQVRFRGFWLISVLNYLLNNQNIQLNAETKNQASNRHFLEFWVVFTVSFFVGNPVYKLKKRFIRTQNY